MKRMLAIVAITALPLLCASTASAYVEFAQPEFPNYLSVPWARGTCHWYNSAWFWACPYPTVPPPAAAPAGGAQAIKNAK